MNRLSLNQITTRGWTLAEAADGCARAGIGWIGVWRDKVAEVGAEAAATILRDHGLRASSLCRGGFFTGAGPDGPTTDGITETITAIDEAATLGADVLVLVVGGVTDDLSAARGRVADALDTLVPVALDRGVRLGVEPLHPMQCTERSVVSTLAQALDLVRPYPAEAAGVVVDEFHVWWDPQVEQSIAAAAGRIAGFHVCGQQIPLTDTLLSRTLPGPGPIDHKHLRRCVESAGYDGPIEVEVFSAALWARPGDAVLTDMITAYRDHVLD